MMSLIDELKEALAEVVDEYVNEISEEYEDNLLVELDEANDECNRLYRVVDAWEQLFAEIFNMPRCLIQSPDDARRMIV